MPFHPRRSPSAPRVESRGLDPTYNTGVRSIPLGWDAARIWAVIEHYERETDAEEAAEIEAALRRTKRTP